MCYVTRMVLTNEERQARHRVPQKARDDYERGLLKNQMAVIEEALNEARRKLGPSEIQSPKSAR